MRYIKNIITLIVCGIVLASLTCKREEGQHGNTNTITGPSIFGHTCTDLSTIPMEWIDSVKAKIKVHYAHTSHGQQLIIGLEGIESQNPAYSVAVGHCSLPNEPGALCIFDGQEDEDYVTPDLYWATEDGMNKTRAVLRNHPEINVSMWAWCTQLDWYSEEETRTYLDSLTELAREFPNVTFVFFTGNAQALDAEGYNRYLRNQQIRQYCMEHHFPCFDFGDLDAWYFNGSSWEQATYEYNGVLVPHEHPRYQEGEQTEGHANYLSCEQKGKAVWWMLARIAGWSGPQKENN